MSQNERRGGLGRGLGELFQRTESTLSEAPSRPSVAVDDSMPPSPSPTTASSPDSPTGAHFVEIPVDAVTPNPRQPRTVFDEDELAELVDSIREVGLLQPIVVRPLDSTGPEPRYELVMGERRWRATQAAGSATIAAIVRDTDEHALLRDALLENLHRTQLNPLEEAAAYQQMLQDFDCTQEELSQRIKRSRPQISNTIRLLRLPGTVQRRVAAGVLSAGHARALLVLEDPLAQERLAQRVVAEGLSVRALEELVTLGETGAERAAPRRREREVPERALELGQQLSDHFETRARVDMGRNRGRVVIEFATAEDLERIVQLMRIDSET